MAALRSILIVFIQFLFLTEILSNYEIILESFEVLLGDKDQMYQNIDMRVKRYNRTLYVAHGNLKLIRPIDNSLRIGFKAYNLAGGQYKLMFSRLLGQACDLIYEDHMRPCVEEFFAATNLSQWKYGQCPIETSHAFIKNFAPTALGDHIPPYVPGGEKWKLDIHFVENDTEILGGVLVYASLRTNYSLLRYGG